MEPFNIIQGTVTLFAAGTATLVSILTFRLANSTYRANRSVEFENYIYKQKHEAYGLVAFEISNIFNFYYDKWDFFTADDPSDKIGDVELEKYERELEKLADEADRKVFQLESLIAKCSFSLSDEMNQLLDDFTSLCYDEDDGIWDEGTAEEKEMHFREFLSRLEGAADRVIVAFRSDLNLGQLHTSIYQRIKQRQTRI